MAEHLSAEKTVAEFVAYVERKWGGGTGHTANNRWVSHAELRKHAEAFNNERTHELSAEVERIVAAAVAEERERIAKQDKRWNHAIDWLLNVVDANDYGAPFWAYVDGLITAKELREESVSVETMNRRRERAEKKADDAFRAARGKP